MFPIPSFNDGCNGRKMNTKNFPKSFEGVPLQVEFSYFPNLIFSNYGAAILFASIVGAMAVAILIIFGFCSPFKIGQPVMSTLSIAVATFMVRRTWPYENRENELMDKVMVFSTIFPQIYLWVTALITWTKDSLWSARQHPSGSSASVAKLTIVRPDPPLVTNFITEKTRDRFPNFRGIVKMLISHVPNLLQGWCVVRAGAVPNTSLRLDFLYHNV